MILFINKSVLSGAARTLCGVRGSGEGSGGGWGHGWRGQEGGGRSHSWGGAGRIRNWSWREERGTRSPTPGACTPGGRGRRGPGEGRARCHQSHTPWRPDPRPRAPWGASWGSWGGCRTCRSPSPGSSTACPWCARACASCGRSSWRIFCRILQPRTQMAFHL